MFIQPHGCNLAFILHNSLMQVDSKLGLYTMHFFISCIIIHFWYLGDRAGIFMMKKMIWGKHLRIWFRFVNHQILITCWNPMSANWKHNIWDLSTYIWGHRGHCICVHDNYPYRYRKTQPLPCLLWIHSKWDHANFLAFSTSQRGSRCFEKLHVAMHNLLRVCITSFFCLFS